MAIAYPTAVLRNTVARRELTADPNVVLDAWYTKHGDSPVNIPQCKFTSFDTLPADWLLDNMTAIVQQTCQRHIASQTYRAESPDYFIYAKNDGVQWVDEVVCVRVVLKEKTYE